MLIWIKATMTGCLMISSMYGTKEFDMKAIVKTGVVAASVALIGGLSATSSAWAQQPSGSAPAPQATQTPAEEPATQKTELSMEQVIAKLKEQGYSDISEIEREGGRYCVEARDAEGKEVEIHVDAKTGEIVKNDKADLSKDEVIAKLKEQGYPKISELERQGDRYWVMARDADGKEFELHVSAKTGEIVRKEQEGG